MGSTRPSHHVEVTTLREGEGHNRYFWTEDYILFYPGGLKSFPGKRITWESEADSTNKSDSSLGNLQFSLVHFEQEILQDIIFRATLLCLFLDCLQRWMIMPASSGLRCIHSVKYSLLWRDTAHNRRLSSLIWETYNGTYVTSLSKTLPSIKEYQTLTMFQQNKNLLRWSLYKLKKKFLELPLQGMGQFMAPT
jgi:hypothetical protein